MIEVEIRAKVSDFNEVKKNLQKLGAQFIDTKIQIDRVFGHDKYLDENNMVVEGGLSARLRQVGHNTTLDFKEIVRGPGGLEISIDVTDEELYSKLLHKLGFKEAFTIRKSREAFLLNSFTVCLDDVEALGKFIEIEKLAPSSTTQEPTYQECQKLLKKLYPGAKIEKKKYGDLMQAIINKNNGKK